MFIYDKLDGLIITIDGPILTLIYPYSICRAAPFEKADKLQRQELFDPSEENMIAVYQQHLLHELCHPPKDSEDFKKIYHQYFFGLFRLYRSNELFNPDKMPAHYHYAFFGDEYCIEMFKFLKLIADFTEKGVNLILSLNDWVDLKRMFQCYLERPSIKLISERVIERAVDYYFKNKPSNINKSYLRKLFLCRKKAYFFKEDVFPNQYKDTSFPVAVIGHSKFPQKNIMDIQKFSKKHIEFFKQQHPLKFKRKYPRILNKQVLFFLGLTLIFLEEVSFKNVCSKLILAIAVYIFATLFEFGQQEPRHVLPAIKSRLGL